MTPRDNQRQRLYDAERSIKITPSRAATKYLIEGEKVASTGSVSIGACQSYADYVASAAWFQTRWGKRSFSVRHKTYGNATGSIWGSTICLPPWARGEVVILHEMAHCLTPARYAPHGPEFAGIFLTLLRYQCGPEAAKSMRDAFRAHRVKKNLDAVPKPGVRPVTLRAVAQKKVAARARVEKADGKARLLTYHRRREAAEAIRAQIEAGMFGESRTAARNAALATARRLERGK